MSEANAIQSPMPCSPSSTGLPALGAGPDHTLAGLKLLVSGIAHLDILSSLKAEDSSHERAYTRGSRKPLQSW